MEWKSGQKVEVKWDAPCRASTRHEYRDLNPSRHGGSDMPGRQWRGGLDRTGL